ncbi:hypothetical protein [Pelagicoccus mobilis]|uniref:Uncharacterized protein n=1 Tax=Pelagicoccus mobilis TaxID=415221 RepID=A0A934VJL6_9BACT|nr:hypothetical protein [Pelagicoccus mobilis]MBK1875751.1 hypothetical protein [Pelagicoccus mobilis]
MSADSQTTSEKSKEHFIPRKFEMEALKQVLPVQGTQTNSNRVFNIWGSKAVGKSSFISEFRESEVMSKAKLLWLHPTRKGQLDTIPEFIRACAQTIRYPSAASKEKKISERLESVQRGKVNPIVSDDSLLITRSSVARQKKPYINQAAASSVGRTEVVRDDVEVNVGLGESKATNHAEAFLDALPLQSLGTDLSIIYIEKFEDLSVSIVDWLRDYVFPAATNGAYRRSLILLIESLDPLNLAYPNESWGVWSNKTEDFQLYPYSDDDVYSFGLHSGLEPDVAHFLKFKTLGYPAETHQAINELKSLDRSKATQLLDSLPAPDQLKVAALAIPQAVHKDDLPILFGKNDSEEIFDWFKNLPNTGATLSASGKAFALSDSLRAEALRRFKNRNELQDFSQSWGPMARVTHLVPNRTERSKLLLLSGLYWIDQTFCQKLFGEQATKISPFITQENSPHFNRKQERYRISERLLPDLQKAATRLEHPGVNVVKKKAEQIWEKRLEELKTSLAELDSKSEHIQTELRSNGSKQKEIHTQIRIQERASGTKTIPNAKPGFLSKILNLGDSDDVDADSPEGLRKLGSGIAAKINELEQALDAIEQERQTIKTELDHPSIAPSPQS